MSTARRPPAGARLHLRIALVDESGVPLDHHLLRRVARRVVAGEGLRGPYDLSIRLTDDCALRVANRAHRGLDRPTDVLSFPLLPRFQQGDSGFVLPPDARQHLGDVLISVERARAQAAEYGHAFEREVCYLLAHGVLHLLGHDHEEQAERKVMREREEAALAAVGLFRR
jgi:probable rRNA maturation factor